MSTNHFNENDLSTYFRPRLHALEYADHRQENNWIYDAEFDSMERAKDIYLTSKDSGLINVTNKNKFIQLIDNCYVNMLTITSAGSLILISLVDKDDIDKRYVVKILLQKTDDEQFSFYLKKEKKKDMKSVLDNFYDKIAKIRRTNYSEIFTEDQFSPTFGIQEGLALLDYKEYKKESDIQSLIAERYIQAESEGGESEGEEMKENSGSYPFSPKMHSLHSVEGANTEILEALLKNITPEAKRRSDFFDASNVVKQKRKNRFLAEYIRELILVKPYLPLVFIVMESVPKYYKTINEWKEIFKENEVGKHTEYTIETATHTFIFDRLQNAYWVYIQLYRMARLGFNHCDTHGGNIFIANPIISVIPNEPEGGQDLKNEIKPMTLYEIFINENISSQTRRDLGRKIGIEQEQWVETMLNVYTHQHIDFSIPLIYLIDFGLSRYLSSSPEKWNETLNDVIKCFSEPYFGLIWKDAFDLMRCKNEAQINKDCEKLPNPKICGTNITQPDTPRDGYYEAKWEEIGDKVDCFSCVQACKKRKELMDERKNIATSVSSKLSTAGIIPEKNENNNDSSSLNFSNLDKSSSIKRGEERDEMIQKREQNRAQQENVSAGGLFYNGGDNSGVGNYGGGRRKKRKKTRKKRRKRRTRKQKKRSKATKRKKVKKTKTRKLK